MDHSTCLNSLETLRSTVKKSLPALQMKWAKIFKRVIANVRDPTFTKLTEFVSSSVRMLPSRFGQISLGSAWTLNKNVCST